MAPKVQVPADFGKHHIGAVSHGNLIFKLKDGAEVKANSMILSLNSPVIDHLTTNLDQQTLDADDFEKDAVDCFIEAAYTGELENINQSNFRDVNKMSCVFKVSWLTERCAEYFEMLVSQLQEREYDEILFVVEEARFVCEALKKRTFLGLVIGKLASMVLKKNAFVEKYMANFIDFGKSQLDIVVEIAGEDVHVLVQILTSYLESHKEGIDKNARYLIENIDLALCWRNNNDACHTFFKALEDVENVSKDDFKMLLNVSKHNVCGNSTRAFVTSAVSSKVPNLFHSFEKYMTTNFENTFNQLSVSEEVSNLYMFFDGLWLWFTQRWEYSSIIIKNGEQFVERVIQVKHARRWGTIAYEYLERIYPDGYTKAFVNLLKNCGELVSKNTHYSVSSTLQYTREEFIESIFLTKTQIKFKSHKPMVENCTEKSSSCGIVLQTNPPSRNEPNMFDIRLVTDPNECPLDLHLHNNLILAKSIHIAIEVPDSEGRVLFPLSWCDKPFYDDIKQCWGWGYIALQPEGVDSWPIAKGRDLIWNYMTARLEEEEEEICFTLFYSL